MLDQRGLWPRHPFLQFFKPVQNHLDLRHASVGEPPDCKSFPVGVKIRDLEATRDFKERFGVASTEHRLRLNSRLKYLLKVVTIAAKQ